MLAANKLSLYCGDMSLAERLTKLRTDAKLSQDELAKLVGMTQQAIQAIEDGTTLQPRKLKAIALALGSTPEFLQFGVTNSAQETGSDYVISPNKYAMIPRYAVVAGAGASPENGHEEISGSHAYRRDWLERKGLNAASLVVIEVLGQSMEPSVNDGDVVLVNTAERRIANGAIFAFRHEDGPRIKRLHKQLDGRVRVVSDNPDKISYPDEWLTPGMDVQIIGRVVHRSGGV